jgi:hypothetical protein
MLLFAADVSNDKLISHQVYRKNLWLNSQIQIFCNGTVSSSALSDNLISTVSIVSSVYTVTSGMSHATNQNSGSTKTSFIHHSQLGDIVKNILSDSHIMSQSAFGISTDRVCCHAVTSGTV